MLKKNGLTIPIIYNTNGYENIETIKSLEGYIDVYLPDLKYFDDEVAGNFSNCKDYFKVATKAILEMKRQVQKPLFDDNGMILRGLIVRHLILPNHIMQTKKILGWIAEEMSKDTYISIMTQYFPTYIAKEYNLLNRKISKREYNLVLNMIQSFENGYIQEYDSSCDEEKYVPNF